MGPESLKMPQIQAQEPRKGPKVAQIQSQNPRKGSKMEPPE